MNLSLLKLPAWATQIPPVSFLWADMLWLLLIVPAAAGLYFYVLKRKRKAVARYGKLGAIIVGPEGRSAWRRYTPPVLYLIGLTLILTAIARPAALIATATNKATVILAMDVSGSMRAGDVKPTRIQASQDAAKAFIKTQPKEVQIGIVAFAGTAQLVQQPTTDHAALIAAVDAFELQRGTAVGSGILKSLQTLFPGEQFNVKGMDLFTQGYADPAGGTALGSDTGNAPTLKKADPVEPGSLKTAIVILMTDGNTRIGPDPVEVARLAAEKGLRVYTIGFGSRSGAAPSVNDNFGFGGGMRASLNEAPLKQIADITRSKYYFAGSYEELTNIYTTLSKQRIVMLQETEITAFVAGLAALFTLASAILSVLWFNRIF